MTAIKDFLQPLEEKVTEQLASQRVGYLLGAGSSYLEGYGYPLTNNLWGLIKSRVSDSQEKDDIQAKLDAGATGIEQALDLLDDGGAQDTPHRYIITNAIADLFATLFPKLDFHIEFVKRLSRRIDPYIKVFSLNYDPLIERAAELTRVRLTDGFLGLEHAYFEPAVFDERIGRIRGTYKGRQFEETVKPIHLLKLHGSLGWYECPKEGVRKCGPTIAPPNGTKRLMIPPQRRKASDTMLPPYSALWSSFRGCLGHNVAPINRLVCLGYGFGDEHVNSIIENALVRPDFTLLVFTRTLFDAAWARWSGKKNTIVVTENRCSLKGAFGPGHTDLWSFERLCREV